MSGAIVAPTRMALTMYKVRGIGIPGLVLGYVKIYKGKSGLLIGLVVSPSRPAYLIPALMQIPHVLADQAHRRQEGLRAAQEEVGRFEGALPRHYEGHCPHQEQHGGSGACGVGGEGNEADGI